MRRPALATRARVPTPARVHATWVKQSASIDVEAGKEMAYDTYSDIEEMPNWCVLGTFSLRSKLSRSSN